MYLGLGLGPTIEGIRRRRVANAAAAVRQAILDQTPAIYCPLDETSGTVANDISGNNRHGTYTGSVVLADDAIVGSDKCPNFTGGYVTDFPTTSLWTAGYTVLGWIRPRTLGTAHFSFCEIPAVFTMWSRWDGVSNRYMRVVAEPHALQQHANVMAVGVRSFIAMRFDRTTVGTYHNDTLSSYASGGPYTIAAPTGPPKIGKETGDNVAGFPGHMSHFAFFPRALTDAEILSIYEAGL